MIRAVIFDMLETLITHYKCPLYFGAQMAADAGISEKIFQELWRPTESDRSIGKIRTEEAEVIRKSMLFQYFDKVCLSYEEGVQKPDEEIYRRCMAGLGVAPEECIYIGDGGSQELEAARDLGMNAMQAVWYMDNKKKDFLQLEKPLDVLKWIR